MTATGSHGNFDSLRGAPPFTQGSRGCSYTSVFAFFNNIFMRANSLWRAVPKRTDRAPEGGSKALEENRQFTPGASPDSGASARPPPTKAPTRICRERHPVPSMSGVSGTGTAAVFGFLADTRIGLFGIPATFAPGKSDSGRCFSLKQEGFKLLRLPNWGKNNCEHFVDISLERYYNTGDEPECANIPALRLETRFASAERQTVRRVIYD